MPLGSATADIQMINIAVSAADGSGQVWQDAAQMIPHGMNGDPEGFVAAIKAGLPLVNNLRVLFNEYSFNPDGSLHPDMERFLTAAAAEGYQLTMVYGGGDAQNIGIGDAEHPALTNAEAFAALEDNYPDVAGAWEDMLDWMDANPTTKAAVYGWELMNEAAGYRHSVRANGSDANLSAADFVTLYAQHSAALADLIQSRTDGRILVGGWGYNGDFLTLANTAMEGTTALDYLRAAIGPDLVWSAHLYPGWMGTNLLTDPAALEARLNEIYGVLSGDDILLTETNIDGAVDDPSLPYDYSDLMAQAFEWFADNGIGLGWYPGLQTGSSSLLYVENDGSLTLRHQHSFAHAMNGFSLGADQPAHAGNELITTVLTDAALRNEPYEILAGEATFDPLTKMGTAFGFAGSDTLQGTALSNDFLYGGTGGDVLRATGGDDFLFGQGGSDRLVGGTGIDHLFGGYGNDTLDAGSGANVMTGGRGDDLYIVRSSRDVVREYPGGGADQVSTTQRTLSFQADQYAAIEALAYIGNANFRGTGNGLANTITGGAGHDTLSGGGGQDTLTGQGGDDRLSGDAGADHFAFVKGFGADEITDFSDNTDTLVLAEIAAVNTVAQALAKATQVGADVLFDFGPAGSILVRDATLAALADDILVL